jgi:hypothetical protein
MLESTQMLVCILKREGASDEGDFSSVSVQEALCLMRRNANRHF